MARLRALDTALRSLRMSTGQDDPPPKDASATGASEPAAPVKGACADGEEFSAAQIATKSARGAVQAVVRVGGIQLLQLGSTLLIARLVAPAAYGSLAIALAAVGFTRYAGDLGMMNSFLPLPRLDRAVLQTGAFVALVLSVSETGLLIATAPVLASLLHGPSYSADLIRALAVCIVLESLRFGPLVGLNRTLQFGRYGALALTETLILYVSQIFLLLTGFGVWALVLGQLARSSIGTALYIWKGGGLAVPAVRTKVRPLVQRALPYQGPAIVAAAGGLLFPLLLTVFLSAKGIGFWSWSTVLATPLAAVVTLVSWVALPSLANLRRVDPGRVARATDLILRSSVVVPAVGAGLLLGFSSDLVRIVFGSRWSPALVAVELNLLGVIPAALSAFLAAVLESAQRARERFVAMLIAQAIGLALAAVLASQFSVSGAAFASAIAIPAIDVVVLGRMARIPYSRAVLRSCVAFLCAAAVGWALGRAASTLPWLVACMIISLPPSILITWWSDRDAARFVLGYGVRVPTRLAVRLGLGTPGTVAR
jgi:O-antigen/teichoic acid export membrane protein